MKANKADSSGAVFLSSRKTTPFLTGRTLFPAGFPQQRTNLAGHGTVYICAFYTRGFFPCNKDKIQARSCLLPAIVWTDLKKRRPGWFAWPGCGWPRFPPFFRWWSHSGQVQGLSEPDMWPIWDLRDSCRDNRRVWTPYSVLIPQAHRFTILFDPRGNWRSMK